MSQREIKILLESTGREEVTTVDDESCYEDLADRFQDLSQGQITLAKVNNCLHELCEKIATEVKTVSLLDTVNTDAYRVYMRTLTFVFLAAAQDLYPDLRIVVEHSISGGAYSTLRDGNRILPTDSRIRDLIKEKMREIVEKNTPIECRRVSLEEALQLFEEIDRPDKVALLRYRQKEDLSIYQLGSYRDTFHGYMLPSAGHVSTFDLELFNNGLVLIGPVRTEKGVKRIFTPQPKLSDSYNEQESWTELQGISTVAQLNAIIEAGGIGEVCRVTEALQSDKIMKIAEEIRRNNKRIILIAAPSSSGKTSFAYKLRTRLRVLGLRPISISLDDYYVNRKDTPLDEQGNYDFEALHAIDLGLFNKDLNKLLQGQAVERIRFDFIDGVRVHTGQQIRLTGADPIIIEGIHGLNPALTAHIDESYKYRIYLSVITQINLDDHNRIPTTDLRLMRRMARDKQFRGKPVEGTILEWNAVRRGEKRNIFPYQEEANVVFNSSFVFEIAALKPILQDDLENIPPDNPAHIEAKRILAILQYFVPMEDTSDVINTSILREFIGGSKIVH